MLTIVGMLVAQDTDRAKPATTETDDLVAFAQGANSDGADRGIQPRHVPAAGENTDHALLGGDGRHIGLNSLVILCVICVKPHASEIFYAFPSLFVIYGFPLTQTKDRGDEFAWLIPLQ